MDAEPTSLLPSEPTRQRRVGRRMVLPVMAVVALVAALFVVGLDGLIQFGLLLAFSADADEEGSRRSVIGTHATSRWPAMSAAFARFWLWHYDLTESALVLLGGALMAYRLRSGSPLVLQRLCAPSRSRIAASSRRSGASWSSSTSSPRMGGASVCWWQSVSSCLSYWPCPGHGAPAEGGSSSSYSATRFAERCDLTWCRLSTSGPALGLSRLPARSGL
jgi:hypothetical protein